MERRIAQLNTDDSLNEEALKEKSLEIEQQCVRNPSISIMLIVIQNHININFIFDKFFRKTILLR